MWWAFRIVVIKFNRGIHGTQAGFLKPSPLSDVQSRLFPYIKLIARRIKFKKTAVLFLDTVETHAAKRLVAPLDCQLHVVHPQVLVDIFPASNAAVHAGP